MSRQSKSNEMIPTIYVIAGPNGAGKTTFATQYLPKFAHCRNFLNADLIAAGLSPFAPELESARAGRTLLTRFRELREAKQTFAVETTLAGKSYARLFLQMKGQGYRVVLFFLWLPEVEMAIARVANRVRQGGHSIPEEDIRRRYPAGLENFAQLYQSIADEWWLIAGGHGPPIEVARKADGRVQAGDQARHQAILSRIEGVSNVPSNPSDFADSDKLTTPLTLVYLKAIDIARQTNTPVVVWQDDKVREIPWGQVAASQWREFPLTTDVESNVGMAPTSGSRA